MWCHLDNIQVVPHKVVTYREGDFFKCHVDSCEDTTYVGSLIIGLTDGYEGGELKVRHGNVIMLVLMILCSFMVTASTG